MQLHPSHTLQTAGTMLSLSDSLCGFIVVVVVVFLLDFTLDLCFLADHFTSGAVLSGHSSQFTVEELLVSG